MNCVIKISLKLSPCTKQCLLGLFVFGFLSCERPTSADKYAGYNETDKIIEAIINKVKLPVFKQKGSKMSSAYVVRRLMKNEVFYKTSRKKPLSEGAILLSELYKKGYFGKADSASLLQQNSNISTDTISKVLQNKIFTDSGVGEGQINSVENLSYWRFGIPLYSKNKNRVFVEMTWYCSHCEDDQFFILDEKGGDWTVVASGSLGAGNRLHFN